MAIDATTSFSPDYARARAKFRAAAERRGWACIPYPIGVPGPAGEELAIDVAVTGPSQAEQAFVVSSGLHGVEGFLGSAVQVAILDGPRSQALPPELRYVFVHALNPYGFAWSRRVDAENVDPNRNFLAAGDAYRGCPDAYARLDAFLNPRRPPARWDTFALQALAMLARHGKAALKEAIVTGQYEYPRGLFFGGKRPSRTQSIVKAGMPTWLGGARSVLHLDFHAGLGAWGEFKLLADVDPSAIQRAWIERTFGPQAFAANDPGGVAYETRGSFGRWCTRQDFAPGYLVLFAECGTYGNLRVLGGLRAENQAHHWGDPEDPRTKDAKARLRELFCPADPEWRKRVLAAGCELVAKAASALVAGKPP